MAHCCVPRVLAVPVVQRSALPCPRPPQIPRETPSMIRMLRQILLPSALLGLLALPLFAADKEQVPEKWYTPYDLYLDPAEAHAMKTADPEGVLLIDVRSRAEVQLVGFAELADANIPIFVFQGWEWKPKKDGLHGSYRKAYNSDFVAAVDRLLASRGKDRSTPLILMCTSGSRSPIAAEVLHEAGFAKVYTQYQGFEGIKAKQGPERGQRVVNGWKNAGLPWSYQLKSEKMYFNFDPRAAAAAAP
jgi:rhodanese-related sulfurtransferase